MKIDGTKVADANKPLDLKITQKDCSTGSTKDPATCAAARAICRMNDVSECRVHIARVYLKKKDKWIRFATPPALRTEIIAFDKGGQFSPGDYRLAPIQPSVRFGAPKKKKVYKRDGSRPQKRLKPHVVQGIRARASQGTEYK